MSTRCTKMGVEGSHTQRACETFDPHVFCKVESRWAKGDTGEMNGVREWREGGVLLYRAYSLV